jgi:hypothetical protein
MVSSMSASLCISQPDYVPHWCAAAMRWTILDPAAYTKDR